MCGVFFTAWYASTSVLDYVHVYIYSQKFRVEFPHCAATVVSAFDIEELKSDLVIY